MSRLPRVDVNLFVFNGAATVRAAIESVLVQTWPNLDITLIDDGSTDGTADILDEAAASDPRVRVKHNRVNGGAIANFQRAFWLGDADFVLPKSGDDLIAPDFVETTMAVLRRHPQTAMCHAAGVIFKDGSLRRHPYPAEHALHAVGPTARERAGSVMATYTSSPSFWGVYRRAAVDRLAPIRFRAGWDHVLLAELALHGEIRHVQQPLYWRRDGGKPVDRLARASTEQGTRGVPLDDRLGELRWRTPLITTAYAHLEAFAASRLPEADRLMLMADAAAIFRGRWLPAMHGEAARLCADLPRLMNGLGDADPLAVQWRARTLGDTLRAVETILPELDLMTAQLEIAALAGQSRLLARAA